jgi:1,2-diacylglycerol 3-alpha-glucosyltransferase
MGLADRVFLLGQVPYEQVPAVLRLADVFVTASQTEVHPFSLIEALASGLPALGVQSPGVSDTLVAGENGLISAPDVGDFAAKLARLVKEPGLRRRMGAQARELAWQYDINHTGQRVLDEYERLAAQRARVGSAVRTPSDLEVK